MKCDENARLPGSCRVACSFLADGLEGGLAQAVSRCSSNADAWRCIRGACAVCFYTVVDCRTISQETSTCSRVGDTCTRRSYRTRHCKRNSSCV